MAREVLVLQCVGQELLGGCSAEVALLDSPGHHGGAQQDGDDEVSGEHDDGAVNEDSYRYGRRTM